MGLCSPHPCTEVSSRGNVAFGRENFGDFRFPCNSALLPPVKGFAPMWRGILFIMSAAKGDGHLGKKTGVLIGPPTCPHLNFAPKWRDSVSRGRGEAARRVWRSEPAPALTPAH